VRNHTFDFSPYPAMEPKNEGDGEETLLPESLSVTSLEWVAYNSLADSWPMRYLPLSVRPDRG
jgi:hypothetical protein